GPGKSIEAVRLTTNGETNLGHLKARGELDFQEARLGSVNLAAGVFSSPVNFFSTSIGQFNCSSARLRGRQAEFNLSGATLVGLFMDYAWFGGKCNFVGLRVEKQVSATSCVFLDGLDFYEGYVGRGAFFWHTSHKSDAQFSSLTVLGELYHSGSRFRAALHADLGQLGALRTDPAGEDKAKASVGQPKRESTVFEKDFSFRGSRILGRTSISKTKFRGMVSFDGSAFAG